MQPVHIECGIGISSHIAHFRLAHAVAHREYHLAVVLLVVGKNIRKARQQAGSRYGFQGRFCLRKVGCLAIHFRRPEVHLSFQHPRRIGRPLAFVGNRGLCAEKTDRLVDIRLHRVGNLFFRSPGPTKQNRVGGPIEHIGFEHERNPAVGAQQMEIVVGAHRVRLTQQVVFTGFGKETDAFHFLDKQIDLQNRAVKACPAAHSRRRFLQSLLDHG